MNGDVESLGWRTIIGLFCSELVTMLTGASVAIIWKSAYSFWFMTPIAFKILAMVFQVRREKLKPDDKPETQDRMMAEFCDINKGFFLIEGPESTVLQFFRHYGHPERSRRGLRGDRVREWVSMACVFACMMIFPFGAFAFAFAPPALQWVWIGYQLYATFSMFIYHSYGGESLGTTEQLLARALYHEGSVQFCDGDGTSVFARVRFDLAQNVNEGRWMIQERKEAFKNTYRGREAGI